MTTRSPLALRAKIGFLVMIFSLAQGCSFAPKEVRAQDAIRRGFGLNERDINSIPDGSFVKLERTHFRRAPIDSNRPDPYHREESDTLTETNWIIKGGVAGGGPLRFEQRDGKTGQLRLMTLIEGNKLKTIDLMFGNIQIVDFDRSIKGTSSIVQQQKTERLRISETDNPQISGWNAPAWVVSEPVDPTEGVVTSAYVADLSEPKFERRWTVDRSSNQLIEFELLATSGGGQITVLERVTSAPPVYGKIQELPTDWFSIDQPIPPVAQKDLATFNALSVKQIFDPANILRARGTTRFALFQTLNEADGTASKRITPINMFRITEPGMRGPSVELRYDDVNSNASIRLIQGPSNLLVPAMKLTAPDYSRSSKHTIAINGREITVWFAGFNNEPNSIAMFEYEDLFVYVSIQNSDETTLRDFLSTLK